MNLKEFEESDPELVKVREETLSHLRELEEQEYAIRSLAAIGRYLANREDITPQIVDAWHTLSDYIVGFSNE